MGIPIAQKRFNELVGEYIGLFNWTEQLFRDLVILYLELNVDRFHPIEKRVPLPTLIRAVAECIEAEERKGATEIAAPLVVAACNQIDDHRVNRNALAHSFYDARGEHTLLISGPDNNKPDGRYVKASIPDLERALTGLHSAREFVEEVSALLATSRLNHQTCPELPESAFSLAALPPYNPKAP